MLKKEKIKAILKRAIAPVTIMFIPHSNTRRTLNLNIPAAGIMISAVLCCFGILYLSSMILDVIRYQAMEKQIRDYSQKVSDFNATLLSLKKAEKDLHQLISLGSKEKILETIDTSDMGAIDINQIQKQITSSMQTVGAIKDYLTCPEGSLSGHTQGHADPAGYNHFAFRHSDESDYPPNGVSSGTGYIDSRRQPRSRNG